MKTQLAIGPAEIDGDTFIVTVDGVTFFAGEKYTILELGWAVYISILKVPEDWMRARGETRPRQDGVTELRSKPSMLITSHPVLVALAIRAWWHRNGREIASAPDVVIPSFDEAVGRGRTAQDSQLIQQAVGRRGSWARSLATTLGVIG